MRNPFPISSKKFGDRLDAIMKYNNMDCLDLAVKIKGLSSKPKSTTKEYEECKTIAKTIRNHLQLDALKDIPTSKSLATTYLIEYCQIFNCSADYFLGFIDYPTYQETDIGKTLGLTDKSINALIKLYELEKVTNHGYIDTLNLILSYGGYLWHFLFALKLYIDNGYNTVMVDKIIPGTNSIEHVPRELPEYDNNGNEKFWIGKKKDNGEYNCIALSTDIVEAHAMQLIQKTLKKWQEQYKKECD